MTIYWALLIFSCLFYPVCTIVYNRRHKLGDFRPVENENIKIYFVLVAVFMTLIIGLRGVFVGTDTLNYYIMFTDVRHAPFSFVFESGVNDRGFVFLEILAHKLHLSFAGFNLALAIFNVSVISALIYKKSSRPWLSYFIYICFEFFVLELTMVRQTLAMSIVILAVLKDNNENFLDFFKFVVVIFLAYSIHATAIIAIPMWFMRRVRCSNQTVYMLLLLIVLAYISGDSLRGFFQEIAEDLSEKYDMYGKSTAENAGLRLYLMVGASVLLGMFLKRFWGDPWNEFFFVCLCTMMIIYPGVQTGGAIMRIYFYFHIFMIVYVPNLVEALDKNKDGKIKLLIIVLYLIVGIAFFYSRLSNNMLDIVPYRFFWQPLYG